MSFLSTVNQTTVVKFYSNVMDDVLAGVREAFLDEGVDEQILQELRQMWEAKVLGSKAIDPPEVVEPQPPPLQQTQTVQSEIPKVEQQQKLTNGVQVQSQSPLTKNKLLSTVNSQQNISKSFASTTQTNLGNASSTTSQDMNKLVPITLTLPPPAGSQDTQSRTYSIQVPAAALATDQLQRILTAPVISATMALPVNVASTLLQQHVTAALQGQANAAISNSSSNSTNAVQLNGGQNVIIPDTIPGNISQIDGTYESKNIVEDNFKNNSLQFSSLIKQSLLKTTLKNKLQLDGTYDTSDDDDDEDNDDDDDIDDDDDDDDNDDKEDEENDEAENGVEEDPLNSGDDVSEGDSTDLFETENVVVCQYDKINRSRNKWKFYLKDGIMNLAGRDYIFQKANGDAEW